MNSPCDKKNCEHYETGSMPDAIKHSTTQLN